MNIKSILLAISITLLSASAYSADMNYDTARKVYEAGKEVEAYQNSRMNGYTPVSESTIQVFRIVVSIGIFGFIGLCFYFYFSANRESKKSEGLIKNMYSKDSIDKRNIETRRREMKRREDREIAREKERTAAAEAISKMAPAAAKRALKTEQLVEERYLRIKAKMESDFDKVMKEFEEMTPAEHESRYKKNIESN